MMKHFLFPAALGLVISGAAAADSAPTVEQLQKDFRELGFGMFFKRQIEELVEKFPEAFYLWNDGLDDTIMTAEEANAWLRGLRPGIIASGNWWDWGKKGRPFVDLAVTETRHFPEGNTFPGETCWKLEPGWFWEESWPKGAEARMTAEQLAREIRTAHSRNANFLLNVGPDRQGRIVESSLKVLREIPAAMEKGGR